MKLFEAVECLSLISFIFCTPRPRSFLIGYRHFPLATVSVFPRRKNSNMDKQRRRRTITFHRSDLRRAAAGKRIDISRVYIVFFRSEPTSRLLRGWRQCKIKFKPSKLTSIFQRKYNSSPPNFSKDFAPSVCLRYGRNACFIPCALTFAFPPLFSFYFVYILFLLLFSKPYSSLSYRVILRCIPRG